MAPDITDVNAFMDPLDLPFLSTAKAKQLDTPSTLEELRLAAASEAGHTIQYSIEVVYFHRDQRSSAHFITVNDWERSIGLWGIQTIIIVKFRH